jgi:hypothetical protein
MLDLVTQTAGGKAAADHRKRAAELGRRAHA